MEREGRWRGKKVEFALRNNKHGGLAKKRIACTPVDTPFLGALNSRSRRPFLLMALVCHIQIDCCMKTFKAYME